MELVDWLLVKDDDSRLTGDIGGVGLLHSEWDREPGVKAEGGRYEFRHDMYCCHACYQTMSLSDSSVPLSDPVEQG